MTFICYINSAIYFSSLGFKFDQQDLMSMCVSQASQTIYLMVMLDNFIAPFSMTLLLSCFFFFCFFVFSVFKVFKFGNDLFIVYNTDFSKFRSRSHI